VPTAAEGTSAISRGIVQTARPERQTETRPAPPASLRIPRLARRAQVKPTAVLAPNSVPFVPRPLRAPDPTGAGDHPLPGAPLGRLRRLFRQGRDQPARANRPRPRPRLPGSRSARRTSEGNRAATCSVWTPRPWHWAVIVCIQGPCGSRVTHRPGLYRLDHFVTESRRADSVAAEPSHGPRRPWDRWRRRPGIGPPAAYRSRPRARLAGRRRSSPLSRTGPEC